MDQSIKRRESPKLSPTQAYEIRAQYRKATAPYSGAVRIDATPEELADRQRMICNGEIPF